MRFEQDLGLDIALYKEHIYFMETNPEIKYRELDYLLLLGYLAIQQINVLNLKCTCQL